MGIRLFSLGDTVLLQRLRRYVTPLHTERALLDPYSPLRTALSVYFPWNESHHVTHILRQDENGLARAGFIQTQVQHVRREASILMLAPSLDAPLGHPAIWHKLIVHCAHDLVGMGVDRLYGDIPDQPLLVNTLKQAGFSLFARETIWRLVTPAPHRSLPSSPEVRPMQPSDRWELQRLYLRVTPADVRVAEAGSQMEERPSRVSEIEEAPYPDFATTSLVLDGDDGLDGCLQLTRGRSGVWLRLWADANQMDPFRIHLLLRFGLQLVRPSAAQRVYIGVRTYQAGLNSILSDNGFAPFTDRARVVRNILQWAKKPATASIPALEGVREAIPGSLLVPKSSPTDPTVS